MTASPRRRGFLLLCAALGVAALWAVLRGDPSNEQPSQETSATSGQRVSDGSLTLSPLPAQSSPMLDAGARETAAQATRLPWGSGPTSIGKPTGGDSHGELPMAMGVDGAGNVLLLDTVNGRVLRLDAQGNPLPPIRLPSPHIQDVSVASDGTLALLDTHDKKSVALLDKEGRSVGELSLVGDTTRDPETLRGVVISGNDVYAESHQGELTRIGDTRGVPDPRRPLAPGVPTKDGRGYLSVQLTDSAAGLIHLMMTDKDSGAQRFSRQLTMPHPVEGIFLLDSDPEGTLYLGLTALAEENARWLRLLCFESRTGTLTGKADVPVNPSEETLLEASALSTGGIVYSVWTQAGVRVQRLGCQ